MSENETTVQVSTVILLVLALAAGWCVRYGASPYWLLAAGWLARSAFVSTK